jgi:hypothetical protein
VALRSMRKWAPGIFPGGYMHQRAGLTVLPPSCADCLEIWEPQPPGTLRAYPGMYWDCFTLPFIKFSRYLVWMWNEVSWLQGII